MDLTFNEQQRAIHQTARDFFSANSTAEAVRELEEGGPGYSQELWKEMAGLDWLGLTYPERYGGAGAGLLDLYPIYIEMGRSIFPSPHLSTVVLAGETILALGSEEQKQTILPRIAKGDLVLPLAVMEAAGEYGPEGVQTTATPDGDGYRLRGAKTLVPYAEAAEQVLVPARTGPGRTDGVFFLVDPQADGVTVEPMDNIAGYRLYAVILEDARVSASAMVGAPGQVYGPAKAVFDRARVLQCAEIVGGGEKMLDFAVGYAKDRVQFGRPIGQYQAVQYLCSDIAIDMHLTSLLSRQAAWLIDEGEPHAKEVAMAKAHASKAAQHMAHQAHEVHAGAAFMLEHDLQLYTRRAKHWEFNLGDRAYHEEQVVQALEA